MSALDNLTPKDFEVARLNAEVAGFDVVIGHETMLTLDLDSEEAEAQFRNELEAVNRLLGVLKVEEWPSKRGGAHKHAVVWLKTPATALERIALQAALGSDPLREILSVIRLRNGIAEPSRLFRPRKGKTL
jgi:hypothetical protein